MKRLLKIMFLPIMVLIILSCDLFGKEKDNGGGSNSIGKSVKLTDSSDSATGTFRYTAATAIEEGSASVSCRYPTGESDKLYFTIYGESGTSSDYYVADVLISGDGTDVTVELRDNSSVSTTVSFDTWFNIMVEWDGTDVTLYVDEEEIGSVSYINSTQTPKTFKINYGTSADMTQDTLGSQLYAYADNFRIIDGTTTLVKEDFDDFTTGASLGDETGTVYTSISEATISSDFDAGDFTYVLEDRITGNSSFVDDTVYEKPSYDMLATSVEDLNTKISEASFGDVIALTDGTYTNVDLDITKSGIVVMAETSGQVFIEGTSTIEISGDDVTLEGFYFRNGKPISEKGAIVVSGSSNRVTNCTIDSFDLNEDSSANKWLSLDNGTTDNEVDHNVLMGKSTEGTMLVVWRNDNSRQDHHIHHNVFKDYENNTDDNNGWEVIRIGTSDYSQSSSYTIVEYNYFEACNGEIEIISNKSGNNIYRYNTFYNNEGMLTIRHGNSVTVDSNYFDCNNASGSGGIRIIDKDHIVSNNYIINSAGTGNSRGAIAISSHVTDPENNEYWEVSNALIEYNTIINSAQSFVYGSSEKENPPASATIAGNLVINDDSDTIIHIQEYNDSVSLDIVDPTYSDNIYYGGSLGLSPRPDGIDFSSSSRPSVSTISETGQLVHDTIGAPEIIKLDESDVGPSYDYE